MKRRDMRRREFLVLPAASLGGMLVYTLAREPLRVQAQTGAIKIPLRFFTAAETRTEQAASERLFRATNPGRARRRQAS